MRIIVSTVTGGLDDRVNPAFGRTPTFTIVDVENGEIVNVQVVPNPGYHSRGERGYGGAVRHRPGRRRCHCWPVRPQLLGSSPGRGHKDGLGPGHHDRQEAVEAFLRGELTTAVFGPEGGMGPGMGRGMGGMGRGMGRGRGGGMGGGRGGGWGW